MEIEILSKEENVMPVIKFTSKAYKWMEALVESHSIEVGFYGVVDRDGDVYTVRDIFYPKHDLATGTTCEISRDGFVDIMKHLMKNDRRDDLPKLKMWGHSHVNMAVNPSGQDESQALTLAKSNQDYLLRIIANKKGMYGITLFDVEKNLKYSNLPFDIIPSEEEANEVIEEIQAILASNISPIDKIADISDVSEIDYNDHEYDKIFEEVEKLKLINIPARPAVKTYGYNRYTTTNNSQRYIKKHNSAVAATSTAEAYKDPRSDSYGKLDPYGLDDNFGYDELMGEF